MREVLYTPFNLFDLLLVSMLELCIMAECRLLYTVLQSVELDPESFVNSYSYIHKHECHNVISLYLCLRCTAGTCSWRSLQRCQQRSFSVDATQGAQGRCESGVMFADQWDYYVAS